MLLFMEELFAFATDHERAVFQHLSTTERMGGLEADSRNSQHLFDAAGLGPG
jgi:hypothetical protein